MRFLVATRNRHKLAEIRAILGRRHQYLCLADFPDAPRVREGARTFESNARQKALAAARWLRSGRRTGRWNGPVLVLADDSGLEVDALAGAPGVRSARYAGRQGDDAANNAKLLASLRTVTGTRRTARFRCVIAAVFADGRRGRLSAPRLFEGVCQGRIGHEPRGQQGFGYDPLFIPRGHERTFAELGASVKDRISHRARALRKLRRWIRSLSVVAQEATDGRPRKRSRHAAAVAGRRSGSVC